MIEKTRRSGAEIGNSLKTMMVRVTNANKAAVANGEVTMDDISKAEAALRGVGIEVRSSNDTFRNFDDIMGDIYKKLDNISQVDLSKIAYQVAGTRQTAVFRSMIKAYGDYYDMAEKAKDADGTTLQNQEKYAESLKAKYEELQATVQSLWHDTINSDVVKFLLQLSSTVLDVIDKVGLFNVAILTTVGILGGKGLLTLIPSLTNGLASLGTALGLAGEGAGVFVAVLGNILPVIAALGVITAITKAYDYFNVTLEESQEKLAEQKQAYNTATSNVKSLEAELKNCKDRLAELNNIGGASVVKDGEQQKLENQTKELQRQLDIAKEKQRIEGLEAEKTATETLGKTVNSKYDYKTVYSELTGGKVVYDKVTRDVELQKVIDDYNNLSEVYESLEKAQQKLANAGKGNTKEFNNNEKELSSLSNKMNDSRKYANSLASEMQKESESLIGATDSGNKMKKIVDNSLSSYTKWLDSIEKTTDATNNLTTSTDSATEATKKQTSSFYSLAAAAEDATGYVNDLGKDVNISDLQNAIGNAQAAVEDYTSILKDMDDNNGLTLEGLQTITQKYPKLLAYIGNEKELREQLKKGIEDQKAAAEDYYKDVLMLDTNYYNAVVKNHSDIVNSLSNYYKTDFGNFKSLAQAKYETDTTLLSSLNKKWADYYNARESASKAEKIANTPPKLPGGSDAYNESIWRATGGKEMADAFTKSLEKEVEQKKKEAEREQYYYNQASNLFSQSDNTGLNLNNIALASDRTGNSKKGKSKSGGKDTKNQFSQVFDWLSIKIDKLKDKAQKAIDSIAKYTSYKYKNAKIDIAVNAKIDEKKSLKAVQDKYNKAAKNVKLPKKYQELVANGGLKIETITNEKLAKKIEDYQKWKNEAANVGKEIASINAEIKELNAQKLDNITKYFDNSNEYINSKISRRQSLIDLKKDRGSQVKVSDYNYLIKLQNDLISNSKKELNAYTKVFNQQVKEGIIKKGSTDYKAGLSYINQLNSDIRTATSSIYDFKTEIRSLKWESFDTGITKINNLKDEISDLADLISDDEALDEYGEYTDKGITKLGLYAEQMSQSKNLVSQYGTAIATLKKELKAGTITQKQYDEELANYQSLQRDAVSQTQAAEEAIANLEKARIQTEIDAIDKETDKFKESIELRKKALQAAKDLHDYEKSISEKSKNITSLQKQIAALKLSTDRKDIAQRLKLENELNQKKDELQEEQYQHSIDAQSDALDDEYDKYEKAQKAKTDALEKSLKDQETLVKNALNQVMSDTTTVSDGIKSLASEHGLTITDSIITPWQNAITAIELYRQALNSLPDSPLGRMVETSEKASSTVSKTVSDMFSGGSSKSASSAESNKKTSNKTLPISSVSYLGDKGELNKDSNIVDRLKSLGYDSSESSRATLWKYFGLSGTYKSTSAQNSALIAAMKKAGFSKGGKGKIVNSLDDEGIALVKRNEPILTAKQGELFEQLVNDLPSVKAAVNSYYKPNISNISPNNGGINVHYDNLINVEGNLDKTVDVQGIVTKAIKKSQEDLVMLIRQRK